MVLWYLYLWILMFGLQQLYVVAYFQKVWNLNPLARNVNLVILIFCSFSSRLWLSHSVWLPLLYTTTGALSTELLNLIWVLYKFSLKINEGKVLHDFPHKVILSRHKQILTNKNGWISVFRGKCFCVNYSQTIIIIRHISWLLHWIPLAPRISLTYEGWMSLLNAFIWWGQGQRNNHFY